MKIVACIAAFVLLLVGSVAADSTPCHACILNGKQWCPYSYSPYSDSSGTCQYSYEYCQFTTVKSTSNCPVKTPSSLTSCTSCTTDSYVWCSYSDGSEYSGNCVSSSVYCSSSDTTVFYSYDCDNSAVSKIVGLTVVAFVFLVVILPCLLLIALVACIVCCCRKPRDPAYVAITTTAPYQQVPAGQPYYAPPTAVSPPPYNNAAGQSYQPPQGYQPQGYQPQPQGYQPQYGYYNPQQGQPQYASQYAYAPAAAGGAGGAAGGANGMGSLGVASANPATNAAGSTNANANAPSYYGVQP